MNALGSRGCDFGAVSVAIVALAEMSVHDHEGRKREHQQQGRKAAEAVQKTAQIYRAALTTGPGAQVLEDLRACYGGSTMGRDARTTEIHAAQRDVLLRIEDLVRLADLEPGAAIAELSGRQQDTQNLLNPWSRYG